MFLPKSNLAMRRTWLYNFMHLKTVWICHVTDYREHCEARVYTCEETHHIDHNSISENSNKHYINDR